MAAILTFDKDRCKGCELCISVCPRVVLALDKSKTNKKGYYPVDIINQENCIGCANCAKICPDSVITVEKE